MVVEDNAVNQLVIDSILRSIGIHATLLNDGAQALRRVSERPGNWDVIFMDCEMPVMDGYQSTREIRLFEQEGHGFRDSNVQIQVLEETEAFFRHHLQLETPLPHGHKP